MSSGDLAARKRYQIAKANKAMFVWVAIASAIVGAAGVFSVFLYQKLEFNQKVIATKQESSRILKKNADVFPKLQQNITALSANENLLKSRAKDGDSALQVILDAMPSSVNTAALGSSLQQVLLKVDDVTIDSLVVGEADELSTENLINFTFTVSVGPDGSDRLSRVLQNLESSIRPINVLTSTIETDSRGMKMTIGATAAYQPAKSIELETKKMDPNKSSTRKSKSRTKSTGASKS